MNLRLLVFITFVEFCVLVAAQVVFLREQSFELDSCCTNGCGWGRGCNSVIAEQQMEKVKIEYF